MLRQPDTQLLAYLEAGVPDPRHKRGQRYEWRFLLAMICVALLSGQKTVRGIVHWMVLHAADIIECLQLTRTRLPSASTIYRALRTVAVEALERQIATYGQGVDEADLSSGRVRGPTGEVLRGQAVDGKDIRGARAHGAPVFLVSVVRHGSGVILGEQCVAHKTNEITAVPSLLAGRDLRGTVTTLDALLTQRNIARQVLNQQGDYVMVVKRNQPQVWDAIDTLFHASPLPRGEEDCLTYSETCKGHGRLETRTLTSSAALNTYLDWPGVQQVFRRVCRRVERTTGEVSEETTYGLTSLSRARALPQHLEAFCRGHWTIENRDHYVRDETLGEDRGQIHTGHAPHALAALRNGILNVLRHQGWLNIADALRHYAASVPKALALIGARAT